MGKTLEDKKIALNMANRAATGAMSRGHNPGDLKALSRNVHLAIDAVDNAKAARHELKQERALEKAVKHLEKQHKE